MNPRIKTMAEYETAYQQRINKPEEFWESIASHFEWREKWKSVLKWDFDNFKLDWFRGGKLNITENCLDRHLETRGDQVAILWEANDPQKANRTLTYRQLHAEVCRAANMLRK